MSENNDLALAKLEAAAEIMSAFAGSMDQPAAQNTDHHQAVADYLAIVFKAIWQAIDESVGK